MYEWDEQKRLGNIQKHGIDFLDVVQVFDGRPQFTYRSIRDKEERLASVAKINGTVCVVLWIHRGKNKRIISAHRADNAKVKKYQELFGETH